MVASTPWAIHLTARYGPYVPLAEAWRWLAFPSADAARQAYQRGNQPVPGCKLSHRRGWFLPVAKLAAWLDTTVLMPVPEEPPTGGPMPPH